jgi:hypothetical protein
MMSLHGLSCRPADVTEVENGQLSNTKEHNSSSVEGKKEFVST